MHNKTKRFIPFALIMMGVLVACTSAGEGTLAPIPTTEPISTNPSTITSVPVATNTPRPSSTPQPCSDVDFNGVWYGTRILLETNDVLATTLTLEQSGCVVTGRYDGDVAGKIEGQIDTDGVLTILDDELEMRYELGEDILVGVVLDAGAAHTGDDVLEKVAEERINIIE